VEEQRREGLAFCWQRRKRRGRRPPADGGERGGGVRLPPAKEKEEGAPASFRRWRKRRWAPVEEKEESGAVQIEKRKAALVQRRIGLDVLCDGGPHLLVHMDYNIVEPTITIDY
jgi:hypothetical protein